MKCANQLGELDVAVSMAEAAIAGGFVRPELVENSSSMESGSWKASRD